MISCDSGHVKIDGNKMHIQAELTTLIQGRIEAEDQVLTEDEVMECVELAKRSKEELDARIESMIQQMSPEQLTGAMFDMMCDFGKTDTSHRA